MDIKQIYLVVILCFYTFISYAADNYKFKTDVIGVQEQYLHSHFWLTKVAQDKVLMSGAAISQFNQKLLSTHSLVNDPLLVPAQVTRQALADIIATISQLPSSVRFNLKGKALTPDDYQQYLLNTNQQAISSMNDVRYGLIVKRADLRTFPTDDKVYKSTTDHDLDRFQESAVFPGEAVAILHVSKDKHWFLVQNYHYIAWVKRDAVAIGNKEEIKAYHENNHFLVITGSKVFTNFVPNKPAISELQLDMGVKLPLAKRGEFSDQLYGQNPYSSYVVKLPVRTPQGELRFALALIARSQDVHHGYLPFTRQNIIKQAFKFLGERYGWGHDYNGRDCTGFIGEVYKTFGFIMPRNTGQQGRSQYGDNQFFTQKTSVKKKMAALKKLRVGDLLYIPGHVMMFLGYEKGQPYVIHDVKGLAYFTPKGHLYQGTLNGVSITPFLPLYANKKQRYVDLLYNIKRLIPAEETLL